jgi:hypothetical protein
MNAAMLLGFVNVFFAGLLAGTEILIHYGLRVPMQVLTDRSQLQLRQALVLRFRVVVPAFFVPTAVSGIAVVGLDGGSPSAWFRWAGLIAVIVWIAIRIVGTIPINSATLTWSLDAPPVNWKDLIDHAERFHIVGTWVAVIAFASFLAGLMLQLAVY